MAQQPTTKKKLTPQERGWTLLQLNTDVHGILRTYCKHHGYKMSAYVGNLIKKNCKLDDNNNLVD